MDGSTAQHRNRDAQQIYSQALTWLRPLLHTLTLTGLLLLAGCAGSPPPADWKLNTVSLLEHHQARWLAGDSRAAELALAKARAELAATGRLDLLARLELAACGTRVAALEFAPCAPFDALQGDAAAQDRAYAVFLSGAWQGLDAGLLAPAYRALVTARDDPAANRAARELQAPLSRLIAAGVLLRQGRIEPATLGAAVDTASAQGWRRPLLTWLEIQHQRARAAGDDDAAQQLQRRIEFTRSGRSPAHPEPPPAGGGSARP